MRTHDEPMRKECTPQELNSGVSTNAVLRRYVFRVLDTAKENDTASRVVDIVLICLIAASVVAVILESVPAVETRYRAALAGFEVLTISIFSIEYLLRVWSSVERDGAASHPVRSRLRFMCSFMPSSTSWRSCRSIYWL